MTPPSIKFHPSEDPGTLDLRYDPRAHTIAGTTYHGRIDFKVPMMTHLMGNLYMGGSLQGLRLPRFIRNMVTLFPSAPYVLHSEVQSVLSVSVEDGPMEDPGLFESVALWACARVSLGPLLIVCQAGLNRSGLISALVLIRQYGLSPEEAVALLRTERSPAALCNPDFLAYVLGQAVPPTKV